MPPNVHHHFGPERALVIVTFLVGLLTGWWLTSNLHMRK